MVYPHGMEPPFSQEDNSAAAAGTNNNVSQPPEAVGFYMENDLLASNAQVCTKLVAYMYFLFLIIHWSVSMHQVFCTSKKMLSAFNLQKPMGQLRIDVQIP
jgi:hypothetical protein